MRKRTPKDFEPTPPEIPDVEELVVTSADAFVSGADLDGVCISEQSKHPVRASDVVIEQSRFQGPALASSTLPSTRITDTTFEHADLSASTWEESRSVRVRFKECKLTGFDARSSELRDVLFKDCKAPDLFLNGSTLSRVRFEECQLTNLDLTDATIQSLAIRDCDARSLRLINTRIDHLDLRGSIIDDIVIDFVSNPGILKSILITPTQAPSFIQAMGIQIAD